MCLQKIMVSIIFSTWIPSEQYTALFLSVCACLCVYVCKYQCVRVSVMVILTFFTCVYLWPDICGFTCSHVPVGGCGSSRFISETTFNYSSEFKQGVPSKFRAIGMAS